VSHAKARQTNVWVVTDELVPRAIRQPTFSFQQLHFMVRELEAHDAAWQRYFATHTINPYIVFYEDFVEHYEETILNIMHYLRIPVPESVQFMPRHLQKQADSESEEWVQRYHDLEKRKGFHQVVASLINLFLPCSRALLFCTSASVDAV
jgi:LPS sulfotransferase NodH